MSEIVQQHADSDSQTSENILGPQRGVADDKAVPKLSVVGIGASAGGLAALKTLVATIPENSGVAFVVVMHLSPDHASHLAELLQPVARIVVQQVTEEETVLKPDHMYIIPPGRNLSAIDSHLRLSRLKEERNKRAPIDHFFRTMAQTHDGNSVGIVLTGTGSDGTLGIQEIKGKGGLTIVQDPTQAEYDGMPQSALATGIIDLVLPLEQMLEQLLPFLKTEPRLPDLHSTEEGSDDSSTFLQRILVLVRTRVGNDFTRYKQSTIMRRIRRRMQLAHIEELSEYFSRLQTDQDELAALANDFLITVTSFFRDREIFTYVEQQVMPELFRHKVAGDQVRVWSVGCATGEEAYSLAMLLVEEAERHALPLQIQVFASDLHAHSLRKAREGLYPGDIETDVSPERLRRFFRKENGAYRIRNDLRDLVVFAPHNLLADPPFSKIDFILCRNVMIYLQRNLQPSIIELFHYALKPRGYLMLGTAESAENTDLFSTESKPHGIYRKRNVPVTESRLPVFPFTRSRTVSEAEPQSSSGELVSFGAVHHRLVERHAPPSILVSTENKVVHISDHAGRFMHQPGGTPTTSVFKLVREELQVELRAGLYHVRESRTSFTSKPVSLRIDGAPRQVTLQAYPNGDEEGETFILVIFEERDEPQRDQMATVTEGSTAIIRELETELELTKRRLKTAIEEYETGQEEMRASNEELQSANEELRSTLEELETSKEELQSINEELQTANQENRHKVVELSQLSDDLQHLMAATHIATLFLDRQLRILRFTPQIGELFSLRTMDRGRPLSDLTHRLRYDGLINDAAAVLAQLVPIEREVQDEAGNWYLVRIRPYRTGDDRIDGVVLTFVDITARKQSEQALRHSEQRYRTLFESMDEGFCVFEEVSVDNDSCRDFRIVEANPAFAKHTGLGNAIGRTIREVAPDQLDFWIEVCERGKQAGALTRMEYKPQILDRWLEVYAYRPEEDGPHVAVLLKDITAQKQSEEALHMADQRKDQFLAVLSHELRNPLAPISNSLHILENAPPQSEQAQTAYCTIKRQVGLLARLVDDLLDLTRVARGKIQLKEAPVELNQLVADVLEDHRTLFERRNLLLNLKPAAEAVWVKGDASRLAQSLGNLLQNCAKFTLSGGYATVTVEVDHQQAQTRVRIKDSGVGMTEEVMAQMFQPFMQGEAKLDRRNGGLGLGLALSKRLLELHSGDITAYSAGPGKGSEFVVQLPLVASVDLQQQPKPVSSSSRPRRILIIEDNVDAADSLRDMLQLFDHQVAVTYGGPEGLLRAREFRPEIVLCDIGLPGPDGFEVAQAFRSAPELCHIYLVALSGYALPADCERAKAAGFDFHLAKPANLEKLHQVFAQLAS